MNDALSPWQKRLQTEFIRGPIAHLAVVGTTGTGKTTVFRWLIDGFWEQSPSKRPTIVYFDIGKSSEILVLAAGLSSPAPLNIILPRTMDLEIEPAEGVNLDIKKSYIRAPGDVWESLIRSRINIICIEPFIRRPQEFTPVITAIFRELIDRAHEMRLPVPLRIFYDEINGVVPGKGLAINKQHAQCGAEIQFCVERIRSMGIGLIGSTQGWTACRKGIRQHFDWQISLRGSVFERGRLSRFNNLFEKLIAGQAIIVYPDKIFSDRLDIPFYGDGPEYGTCRYTGKLTQRDDPRYQEGWMTIAQFLGMPEEVADDDDTEPPEEETDDSEPPGVSYDALAALLDEKTLREFRNYGTYI